MRSLINVADFVLKLALPFGSGAGADVATAAYLVGAKSAAGNLFVGGSSTDFKCVDELGDGVSLLVHVQPFLLAFGVR